MIQTAREEQTAREDVVAWSPPSKRWGEGDERTRWQLFSLLRDICRFFAALLDLAPLAHARYGPANTTHDVPQRTESYEN